MATQKLEQGNCHTNTDIWLIQTSPKVIFLQKICKQFLSGNRGVSCCNLLHLCKFYLLCKLVCLSAIISIVLVQLKLMLRFLLLFIYPLQDNYTSLKTIKIVKNHSSLFSHPFSCTAFKQKSPIKVC